MDHYILIKHEPCHHLSVLHCSLHTAVFHVLLIAEWILESRAFLWPALQFARQLMQCSGFLCLMPEQLGLFISKRNTPLRATLWQDRREQTKIVRREIWVRYQKFFPSQAGWFGMAWELRRGCGISAHWGLHSKLPQDPQQAAPPPVIAIFSFCAVEWQEFLPLMSLAI